MEKSQNWKASFFSFFQAFRHPLKFLAMHGVYRNKREILGTKRHWTKVGEQVPITGLLLNYLKGQCCSVSRPLYDWPFLSTYASISQAPFMSFGIRFHWKIIQTLKLKNISNSIVSNSVHIVSLCRDFNGPLPQLVYGASATLIREWSKSFSKF